MPRMRDLPRLLDENPQMREDFIAMLASFFERHHIEVTPEDLQGAEDVVGYLFSTDFIGPLPDTSRTTYMRVNDPAKQATSEQQLLSRGEDSDDDIP